MIPIRDYFEGTEGNMSEGKEYLNMFFRCGSTKYTCLTEISFEAWHWGLALTEDFGADYMPGLIELHSSDWDDTRISDKKTIYGDVVTSISESLIDSRNGWHHFLESFYKQKETVVKLLEDHHIFNDVIEIISIVEVCLKTTNEYLENYTHRLCYCFFEGEPEELKRHYGKNAMKFFKKYDDLTVENFEAAFETITDLMHFFDTGKFGIKLMELSSKLETFCKLKNGCPDETKSITHSIEEEKPITLIRFMTKYCEKQSRKLLRYRCKSANDANSRGTITLPEYVGEWRSGQAKKYEAIDLMQNWSELLEMLPNLPELK